MGNGLKKLSKLKDWLSVPDAARHLSILIGEDVTEADVLQFALDGRLTLSVRFVNKLAAKCGKIKNPKIGAIKDHIDAVTVDNVEVIPWDTSIQFIEGVWDLTMQGAERTEIERRYQSLISGPEVEVDSFRDSLLVNRADGALCQIVERWSESKNVNYFHPTNYRPVDALPSDAVLVVRTSALQDLEALFSEPESGTERPVGQRERNTLLVIIAALASLAKVEFTKPSKAALTIESETVRMRARVAARTIEDHLNRIPDALESKAD